jgi:acyl transferase domain-containing protein
MPGLILQPYVGLILVFSQVFRRNIGTMEEQRKGRREKRKTAVDICIFSGGQVSGSNRLQPTFGWDEYSATGNAQTMMANRISFFFNLTGPSVNYDTACSAMMTALHGAHASLHANECKLAILVSSVVHYGHAHNPSFAQLGVLSPDGQCRSFDDNANGCILFFKF